MIQRPGHPTDARAQRLTLVSTALASGMTSLPTTALVLALPALHSEFRASVSELQWTMTAYSLAYAALLIVAGRLSDTFGRRAFYLAGTTLWGGASIAALAARSPLWLIVSMAAIGAGSAVLTPASLSLLTSVFPPERRGLPIAVWGGASAFVSGIGPVVGGVLTDDLGWRWIFAVNVPLAVAVLATALAGTPESRDPDSARDVDIRGLGLLVGGLTTLTLALIEGPQWEFYAPQTIVLLVVGVGLLGAFVLAERRAKDPLVDFEFFRAGNYVGGVVVKFAVNFMTATLFFSMSLYMQEILGYSPDRTGLFLLPLSGTFVVALPIGARLMKRTGPRLPILLGLALTATGFVILSDLSQTTSYAGICPGIGLLGLGIGMTVTPMNTAALNAISSENHGQAAGILSTVIGLGSILGVAVSGSVFQELRERKLTDQLAATGPHLAESTQHELEGILVGARLAERRLSTFGPEEARKIVSAIRDGFVSGVAGTMMLTAAIAGLAFVASLALMRQAAPVDEAPPSTHVAD